MATAPETTTRLVTADELLHMPPEPDGTWFDLVRGRLIRVSPSVPRSNEVAAELIMRIGVHVRPNRLGRFGGSEGGFKLTSNPDTVRAPDVWFVRAERVPSGRMPRNFFDGAPDLAVEVLSPTDRSGDVWRRVGEYLDAGARLVWVLDPDTEAAVAFRPGEMPAIISADGELDGENVLPVFKVRLRDLFVA
jgi:Uma2 family endonuclease